MYYYKRLPTYDWLADAGITPSNTTNYTLTDLTWALSKRYGAPPYLGCTGPKLNGSGMVFDEVWYYSNVSFPFFVECTFIEYIVGLRC